MKHPIPALMLLALLALAVAGCGDDNPTSPATEPATADTDAAVVLAGDLAADGGGVTDQLVDIAAAMGDLDGPGKTGSSGRFHEMTYDPDTGTWTLTVSRERGDPEGPVYAAISRVYTLRLLNAEGQPQQFRIVEGDTARTAEFAIVSGTGTHRTPRFEQNLDGLEAAYLITGVHTDLLTVNGVWSRAASNRLETRRFVRTHTSTLDLELIDVVVPREAGLDMHEAISGQIDGTYVADITIETGDDYLEQHIERTFSLVFGDGEATLTMGGGTYRCDLLTGELLD